MTASKHIGPLLIGDPEAAVVAVIHIGAIEELGNYKDLEWSPLRNDRAANDV